MKNIAVWDAIRYVNLIIAGVNLGGFWIVSLYERRLSTELPWWQNLLPGGLWKLGVAVVLFTIGTVGVTTEHLGHPPSWWATPFYLPANLFVLLALLNMIGFQRHRAIHGRRRTDR